MGCIAWHGMYSMEAVCLKKQINCLVQIYHKLKLDHAVRCWSYLISSKLDQHTLFPKRNTTLISRFFMVTLDHDQWPRVMCTKGMYKWNLDQSSLTYTPPQKKGNFRKVAFLLGKSVDTASVSQAISIPFAFQKWRWHNLYKGFYTTVLCTSLHL